MSHHDAHLLDRHAYLDSVVHRLDPRAKVVATFVFILTVVSHGKYEVAALAPFVFFPLLTASLGYVPIRLIGRRLAVATPFVVFIGIFNPLLDRAEMVHLGTLAITGGWVSFASIVLRGLLCVSAAIVLIATTSMPRVAEALGALHIPRALVVQLMLVYRYLFVLSSESGRMSRARALRAGTKKTGIPTAAGMLSSLLIRTVDRSEAIWQAMQVRGFDGQLRTPLRMAWRRSDSLYVGIVVSGCILLRIIPVTQLLGSLIVR